MNVITIILAICSLIIGSVISYFAYTYLLQNKSKKVIADAEQEAEVIKKEKMLQAKERFLQLKSESEKAFNEKNNRNIQAEARIKHLEQEQRKELEEIQRSRKDVERLKEQVDSQFATIARKSEDLDKAQKQQREQLEAISGLSADEAKEQLIESLKAVAK